MVEDPKKEVSSEEEIKELERKLEEKKREIAERGGVEPEEKELFREVLRKHIEEARPARPGVSLPVPPAKPSLTDDLKKKADDIKKQEKREKQVKALIEVALTKSIIQAVRVAEEASPYLLDELHDHLVDDYYDKLVVLRKLKPL